MEDLICFIILWEIEKIVKERQVRKQTAFINTADAICYPDREGVSRETAGLKKRNSFDIDCRQP